MISVRATASIVPSRLPAGGISSTTCHLRFSISFSASPIGDPRRGVEFQRRDGGIGRRLQRGELGRIGVGAGRAQGRELAERAADAPRRW